MNKEIDIQKMRSGINKRKEQARDLKYWIASRQGYRLQINFCLPGSSDHCCITISGTQAPRIAENCVKYLDIQVKKLEERLEDAIKNGTAK